MKLILDAGHGINTPGKRTPDDIREWTLNNRVTVAFQNEIAKYNIDVIRTDDPTGQTDVSLNQRDAIGKKGDVLLSIHHNAFAGKWGDHGGTETLVQPGRSDVISYATAMNNSIVNTLGLRNRGIKPINTQVLRNFTHGLACLVEVGFMDSNTDKVIRDPEASKRVGTNLATAFAQHFNLKLREGKPVPVQPQPATSDLSINGPTTVGASVMASFVQTNNPNFDPAIAEAFIEVGRIYGIRGDVALAQSILETGWFKFAGSSVKADQNNFCGLGATGGGNPGNSFDSIRDGVAAQMQHLMAYANKNALPSGETLLDPRFHLVSRGVAPTWIGLNGRWATGANYGQKILAIYDQMLVHNGGAVIEPAKPSPSIPVVPVAPKKSVADVAQEIVSGIGGWGNNPGRQTKLEAQGYNYAEVKAEVDRLMSGKKPSPAPVKPAPVPVVPNTKYKVGDVVKFSELSTQASGGTVKSSSINEGQITKVYPGTTHPYLINGGSGFVSDDIIAEGAPSTPYVPSNEPKVGDTVYFTQLSKQSMSADLVKSYITSGKITNIYPGRPFPYLINKGSGFVSKEMINSPSNSPVQAPRVGDTVRFTQLSTQSVGGQVVKSSITSGKITKIYPGATYPYLINGGAGFVNDKMIGR